MTLIKASIVVTSPPLVTLCCLSVLVGAMADARAQGVPQANDAEVPAGQHLDPRGVPLVPPPSPPVPVVMTLRPPPAPKKPGRSELKGGGVLVGLSSIPLTAGIVTAALAHPLSYMDCSKLTYNRFGCETNNSIAGIWNFVTYALPTIYLLGGVGMLAGGSALLKVGVQKKRQAVPLISVTPQGSAQRLTGGMLTLSGQF